VKTQCHVWTDGSYRQSSDLGWLITADDIGTGPAIAQGAKTLRTRQTAFDLFIYFALETTPFIPKGYVAKEKQKEEEGRSNKGNPSPSTVRKTRGQEQRKVEMTRKKNNKLTLSSTHVISFSSYPLVHPGRVCPVLIRPVSHRPSHPRQL